MKCGLLDFGMGNITSVSNGLQAVDVDHKIIESLDDFDLCDRIILPGVGAFGAAMERLRNSGYLEKLLLRVADGTPLLGICLGMQLLFESSNELGNNCGLGLIRGEVKALSEHIKNIPIPHVGWNDAIPAGSKNSLIGDSAEAFYFVHSFYCEPADQSVNAALTEYGDFKFSSSVEFGNVFGCQFHPEKSQKAGLNILKKFGNLKC